MARWFVRSGGVNANSGGGNTDAADIDGEAGTDFVIAGGTGLTYAPGGLSGLAANSATYTRSVNLNIAGVRTVRAITVLTDTTATLAASVADGSYGGSIGGARSSLKNTCGDAAGQNAALVSGDIVHVLGGTRASPVVFTESAVNVGNAGSGKVVHLIPDGWIEVDGTGGGAGSDVFAAITGNLHNVIVSNAVDMAFSPGGNSGPHLSHCVASASGGIAFNRAGSGATKWSHCTAEAPTGVGFVCEDGSNMRGHMAFCTVIDGATHGVTGVPGRMIGCLLANCGGKGLSTSIASSCLATWTQNTIVDNTSNGVYFSNAAGTIDSSNSSAVTGPEFSGNIIAGNGAVGVVLGTLPTAAMFDFNNYYNNSGGDRTNVPTGPNDSAVNPAFVNAAGGDYTLDTGSGAIGSGYSHLPSPMKVNIGATIAEVVTAGGGALVNGGLAR